MFSCQLAAMSQPSSPEQHADQSAASEHHIEHPAMAPAPDPVRHHELSLSPFQKPDLIKQYSAFHPGTRLEQDADTCQADACPVVVSSAVCLQSCQLNAYFVDAELEADSHLAKAMGGGNSSAAPNGTFVGALA